MEQGDAGIDVVLSDGERRTYDAVIGADGVYSSVRPMLFGNDGSPSFTGLAAWRIRTPRPPEGECVVLYRGGKHWVGFNPVTNSEGYIFLVEAVANRVHLSQDELMGRLPAMLAGYGGVVARLLPRVTDPASVVYRPIEVVTLRPPWYRGRAILIGDAAHAPAPLVAAGAVIAIEDAVVLAEELVASSTISCAFENFMMRRYKRCGLVVKASLELAAWQKNPRRVQLDPEQVHARIGAELSKPI